MRLAVVVLLLAVTRIAAAATVRGQVYEDRDRDGRPTAGEPGIANAVVAYDVLRFTTTDASGQFSLDVPDGKGNGIVWVRVPDGFVPGPVWARVDGDRPVDLGLVRLDAPVALPLTFVVAADTHIHATQQLWGDLELAQAARDAVAIDPAPAFFTILGDVTQGNQDAEFELTDRALDGLGVPYVPVAGNHDWYDAGVAWFAHYGPDNYSFDVAGVHFVVWNMAMTDEEIRTYLGAELARVDRKMPIVALTHAPPPPDVTQALRELGVAYVLTGHAHTNRVVDHDGVIELNTEPLIMGGLDATPAGYRVVTLDAGTARSVHRATLDAPYVELVTRGCVGADLIAAAQAERVTARIDCGEPAPMARAGGWDFTMPRPSLAPGPHTLAVEAVDARGRIARASGVIEVCGDEARASWPEPPLAPAWTTAIGEHVVSATPAVGHGLVAVATTDLAGGERGGVVALDARTGAIRWRESSSVPVRGAPAIAGDLVVFAQLDGVVRAIDADTGRERWRTELSDDVDPQSGALYAGPTIDGPDVVIGTKRRLAALDLRTGTPMWMVDPLPGTREFQSLANVAVGGGLAVGVFHREIGGVIARDRTSGALRWQVGEDVTIGTNATPVIDGDTVYVATGRDEVLAIDMLTGAFRWRAQLDTRGFDWGYAITGAPAVAHGILVVPTLYDDAVALDAATGFELWRYSAAAPSALHTTHYRAGDQRGFSSAPVIADGVVYLASTDGALAAVDLWTGEELWRGPAGPPVLAGLARAGDAIIVASFDGSVRAFAPVGHTHELVAHADGEPACDAPKHASGGCCDAGPMPAPGVVVAYLFLRRRRRARKPNATPSGHAPGAPPALHR